MNVMLATGLFLVLSAMIYLVTVVRRRGEQFEYAGALFIGELGLMFAVGQMIESETVGLLVTIAFGVSMLTTAVVWWKLFQQYTRHQNG